MFEVSLVFWLGCFSIGCFSLFKNPISMAAMMVIVSLILSGIISLHLSFWFSYILFLVYVGGLLVMFIYISLVSSNHSFSLSVNGVMFSLVLSLALSLKSKSVLLPGFLGCSTWWTGESLMNSANTSIFLFLAVLLLLMLLVVVRISGASTFIVNNEN